MVNARREKKCFELRFFSRMIVSQLPSDDLVTKDIDMDGENENWNWKSEEKLYGNHSLDQVECWTDSDMKYIRLDPPLEFRDNPIEEFIEKFAVNLISKLISEAYVLSCKMTWSIPCSQVCHMSDSLPPHNSILWNGLRLCWTPELFPSHSSACISTSRNSSSSNDSSSSTNVDVSENVKCSDSREIQRSKRISDTYNVPFDSDVYAVPVDVVQNRKSTSPNERKDSNCFQPDRYCHLSDSSCDHYMRSSSKSGNSSQIIKKCGTEGGKCNGLIRKQRFSNASSRSGTEPIHVTVDDVRQYLKTLYANNASEGTEGRNFQDALKNLKNPFKSFQSNNGGSGSYGSKSNSLKNGHNYVAVAKSRQAKDDSNTRESTGMRESREKMKKWPVCRPNFPANLKETLCNIFRFGKLSSLHRCLDGREIVGRSDEVGIRLSCHEDQNPPSPITKPPFSKRALPPLPTQIQDGCHGEMIVTDSTPLPSPEELPPASSPPPPPPPPSSLPFKSRQLPISVDFASSIEKVKDCGWYWGPISGEAAEKILSNEPDGSFIVRDSSDDYYIFSLTFKLNSIIRHVRIEHDQGNFSFGSSTRFKSHTIVDFIESAVEHSRSGRYLFFLHRRPVLGPMRVQLLHPVSRFKQVQSLQHMCRFVILKLVRKDLIRYLPLPRKIVDYLSAQHYYSENFSEEDLSDSSSTREDQHLHRFWHFDREGFS